MLALVRWMHRRFVFQANSIRCRHERRQCLVREPHVLRRLQYLPHRHLVVKSLSRASTRRPNGQLVLRTLLLAGFISALAGCGGSDAPADGEASAAATASPTPSTSNDGSKEKPASNDTPAAPSQEELVSEVPDGTAQELFDFMAKMEIKELGQETPDENSATENANTESGTSAQNDPVEQGVRLRRLMRTRIVACDKIMAKEVPEETRIRALGIKLDALRTLAALDPDAVGPSFQEFIEQMLASGNPLIARMAKATRFQGHVNDHLTSGKETPDQLLEELRQLLKDQEAGPETLEASRDAMVWLLEAGNIDTSAAGLRIIGERFQSHADANLSGEAKTLFGQATQLQLQQQMRQIDENKEGALEGFLQKIEELLQPEKLDENAIGFAGQSALYLEYTGHTAESLKVYEMIWAKVEKNEDTELVSRVRRNVELARKRLQLPGQPIQLEGVTLKGDEFDWSTYRGKWVVVVFWTTWQTDVVQELDRIREVVRTYQDPAVDVVLISLDDDRNALERFLKQNPIGWKIVVQPDPNSSSTENPNAIRCGVESVPFTFLATPDGTVSDIHLMGPRLEKVLSERLKK